MPRTDPFAKALAAASAGPIRRTTGQTPSGNPTFNWYSTLVGTLHRDSCNDLVSKGYVAPVQEGREVIYELTEKGARRLAELRAPERAWLR
jgi:hypothetical protein